MYAASPWPAVSETSSSYTPAGQEFSYDPKSMAHYYRTYLELMDHWDQVLPGQVLRIFYEDVVADIEHSVRRLLSFCGLGFEKSCLEFHKTQRSVSTASSEQVRRPIDRHRARPMAPL